MEKWDDLVNLFSLVFFFPLTQGGVDPDRCTLALMLATLHEKADSQAVVYATA